LSADAIRSFPEANIEAGAALLSDISRKTNNGKTQPDSLADWYQTVAAYSGATDPLVRDRYAQEVFQVIKSGVNAQLESGEMLTLPPTGVQGVPPPLPPPPSNPNSDDYPGALWVPANGNNYQVGREY